MLAILNSLNAHNLPIFQPILMILVSKLMVPRALSDKTYLSLGLLSPLIGPFTLGKSQKSSSWLSWFLNQIQTWRLLNFGINL